MMPLNEYLQIQDERVFEFIDGKKIFYPLKSALESMLENTLSFVINQHIRPQKLGRAYVGTPFVIFDTHQPDMIKTIYVPDMLFLSEPRLAEYRQNLPDWKHKPLGLVPDLVVEIVNGSDTYCAVTRKIQAYLKDGVQLLWLINPEQKLITVYTPNSNRQPILGGEDILTGGDVLPAFQMTVKAIFDLVEQE